MNEGVSRLPAPLPFGAVALGTTRSDSPHEIDMPAREQRVDTGEGDLGVRFGGNLVRRGSAANKPL